MTLPVLGIDVSKDKFDVALWLNQQVYQATFDNTPEGFDTLGRWLKKRKTGQLHTCQEATGRYGDDLALYLHDAGHTVTVVNPLRIKRYAESQLQRNKTDRLDARLIMDFCLRQTPPAWTPPSSEQRELQAMVRQLHALQKMRQQESNRHQSGVPSQAVLDLLQAHLAFLDAQIQQILQKINDHIDQHPDLQKQRDLLATIPGIGKLTASRLLAECADMGSFATARQLAAYAGLTPRHRESGSSIRGHTAISKTGNANLRFYLYMPAVVALRCNPVIQAFQERLLARGKSKMCVVVATMRKLLHFAFGVLKSGMPFDPSLAVKVQIAS